MNPEGGARSGGGSMPIVVKRTLLIACFLAVVGFVAFGVRIEWRPAPAIVDSVALSGEAVGTTFESEVIETEATLAGMSWTGAPPDEAWIRASVDGVEWTEWTELHLAPDHGPDPGTLEAAEAKPSTDPVYFGPINYLQYRVIEDDPAFSQSAADRFRAEVVETSGRRLGLQQRLVRLVSSIEIGGSDAEAVPSAPTIVPNETWGGPQCRSGTQPRTLPRVHRTEFAIVHHAGNNSYAAGQESMDLVYATCVYHVQSRGWWDIAYNFLVDRYGVIYEGRRGSIEDPVRGGHTAGFNSYTVGVALMGNHEQQQPTWGAINALEDFLAWRLDKHKMPVTGTVTVESLGSDKWDEGVLVDFQRISGHRDAKHTACPGIHCYNLLPNIRGDIVGIGNPKASVDFSDFDRMTVGVGGTLVVDAPDGAGWTVSAIQRFGPTVWSESGSGPGTASWSASVEPGPYIIRSDFGSLGIHEQVVQVGDYEWPFVDDEGSYALAEIDDMWDRGITVGCGWNTFCPEEPLTKGELATFVARAMDSAGQYPPYQGHYSDVPDGEWFTGPIEFLVEEGVLPGGGGAYGVHDVSSRAYVVDLILGALGVTNYPSYQGYFTDVPEGEWYTPKIEKAYEMGIALGYPDGTFRPLGGLTRQEAAAFLMRGLE